MVDASRHPPKMVDAHILCMFLFYFYLNNIGMDPKSTSFVIYVSDSATCWVIRETPQIKLILLDG